MVMYCKEGSAPQPPRLRRAFNALQAAFHSWGSAQAPLGALPLRPRREEFPPGPTLAGAAGPRPRFFILGIKFRPAALHSL